MLHWQIRLLPTVLVMLQQWPLAMPQVNEFRLLPTVLVKRQQWSLAMPQVNESRKESMALTCQWMNSESIQPLPDLLYNKSTLSFLPMSWCRHWRLLNQSQRAKANHVGVVTRRAVDVVQILLLRDSGVNVSPFLHRTYLIPNTNPISCPLHFPCASKSKKISEIPPP